ncbi:MAG: type II secretion system protein [Burkholderiales bacterium]
MRSGSAQRGFTYLAMLLAVAVIGIGLAAAGEVWSTAVQREKEQELLFVGDQYRRAIRLYHQSSTDQRVPAAYPRALKDLLEDKRGVATKRHLRKLYADPMTGKAEWGLVPIKAPDGERIMGVYSLSGATPFKTSGFLERDRTFAGANHFSDWKFLYEPQPARQTPKPAAAPPASTK